MTNGQEKVEMKEVLTAGQRAQKAPEEALQYSRETF